jgi:hypothetical protein
MAVQASVLTIVNQALQELGLPTVPTAVSAPDDQTGFQTLGLVNALGTQLVKVHDWQFLEQIAEITGDGVTSSFTLPADFGRIVNQTEWSSSNRRPMFGPMSPQGWSWVQYGIVSVGVYYRYRILRNKFQVFPTPALGEKLHFYYISRNWVYDPITFVYKDKASNDTDEPVFDQYLMTAGCKFKLWNAKGMDATDLGNQFSYMLDAEKAQSTGAPVISLDSRWDYLYISGQNVPDGSWNV